MFRRLALGSTVVLALAAGVFAARPGLVVTRDGNTFEGEVTERENDVVVNSRGIDTVLPRESVASIDYTPYAERFDKQLAALGPQDIDGRLVLARQAFERREYELAQRAVDGAMLIDPTHRPTRDMQSALTNQLRLDEARRNAPPEPRRPQPGEANSPGASTPGPRALLSDEQVNRLRQLELKPDDRVQFQFRDNVRRQFVERQPGVSYRAFAAQPEVTQAMQILQNGGEDLARNVIVRTDPPALLTYARQLNNPLVQGCATSQCHGGTKAGNFRMVSGTDPAVAPTNFFLLAQYAQKGRNDTGNVFGAGERYLIDRGNGAGSLLLQYALPPNVAQVPHPPARGYNGVFRSVNDPGARAMVEWMNTDLGRIRPNYDDIKFQLPSTQPAAAPAAEPDPATTRPAAPTPAPRPAPPPAPDRRAPGVR